MAEGLIKYKGNWIEINKKKLEEAIEAFHKVKEIAKQDAISLKDALRLELGINSVIDMETQDIGITVTNGEWLKKIKESIFDVSVVKNIDIAPTFQATLRTYQFKGYQWLYQMSQLGFGVCLADDMGLGKTIQMIDF